MGKGTERRIHFLGVIGQEMDLCNIRETYIGTRYYMEEYTVNTQWKIITNTLRNSIRQIYIGTRYYMEEYTENSIH